MRKIEIKLYSEYRHYGSHGPKPHKVKATAASKARSILGISRNSSTNSSKSNGPEDEEKKQNRQPKGYGKHAGNTHVETLYSGELTVENSSAILMFLDNVTSRFEAMTTWDVHAAKHNYATYKQKVLNRYVTEYGSVTSEQTSTNLLKELSEGAFDYTQHQIVIVIVSDEQFEGSKPDSTEDGLFRRELRSKRIYSKGRTLLSEELRKKLKECSKENPELITSIRLVKGGRIERNIQTGRLEFSIDFGQLGDRIFDVDGYDDSP